MPRVVPSQVVDLIDRMFPWAAQTDQIPGSPLAIGAVLPRLAAIVQLADQIPGELIILEGDQYSLFVAGLTAIRTAIAAWIERGDVISLDPIRGLPDVSPIVLLRRTLALCPDEYPPVGTTGLNFIQDQELRENLRNDMGSINRALSNSEWKATTVLAGALLEALLLWALQIKPSANVSQAVTKLVERGTLKSRPGDDLEWWTLPPYIEVALELNVIRPDTATQARLAKDYRNLIHPGRSARLGQACDRGTALSAVAAVEHVVGDLTPKTP